MHIDMDVHSEIWFFAPCQSGWKHHHLDPILGAHEDQYHIAAGAQGCLGIDSQASSTRPTMVPCFLRIWSVVVEIWRIECWFLSNLAAETFAKLRQNLWSTSRHKDPTGNFPKNPPAKANQKDQRFWCRIWRPVDKISERNRSKRYKQVMLISTVLLYWRLIRCRSELVQPSCFSTSSSFYRLPS